MGLVTFFSGLVIFDRCQALWILPFWLLDIFIFIFGYKYTCALFWVQLTYLEIYPTKYCFSAFLGRATASFSLGLLLSLYWKNTLLSTVPDPSLAGRNSIYSQPYVSSKDFSSFGGSFSRLIRLFSYLCIHHRLF